MPKQTEALLSYGGVGLLALFLLIALIVGWKMLANFIEKNRDLVKVLVEENRADRESAAKERLERETKQDANRDQWMGSYKELLKDYQENNKHFLKALSQIESGQEKFHVLLQPFAHTKL